MAAIPVTDDPAARRRPRTAARAKEKSPLAAALPRVRALFLRRRLYGGLWRLGLEPSACCEARRASWPADDWRLFRHADRAGARGRARRRWAFAAPVLSCFGASLALAGRLPASPRALCCVGGGGPRYGFARGARHDLQIFIAVLAGGALCWAVGDVRWLITGDVPEARHGGCCFSC